MPHCCVCWILTGLRFYKGQWFCPLHLKEAMKRNHEGERNDQTEIDDTARLPVPPSSQTPAPGFRPGWRPR